MRGHFLLFPWFVIVLAAGCGDDSEPVPDAGLPRDAATDGGPIGVDGGPMSGDGGDDELVAFATTDGFTFHVSGPMLDVTIRGGMGVFTADGNIVPLTTKRRRALVARGDASTEVRMPGYVRAATGGSSRTVARDLPANEGRI